MNINWKKTKAAIVRNGKLKGVRELFYVNLDSLLNIDFQKKQLVKNTRSFIKSKGANHALLWGEMGCGKSSLVRAVFCKFMDKNLRLIEIPKVELKNLSKILDIIRDAKKYKFIIFCDDFSFEVGEIAASELKILLEGSIEKPPSNAIFYATSNKKHLIKSQANNENYIVERENSRENLSLADRFGLQISFYELDNGEFLGVIDSYFSQNLSQNEREMLHKDALAFARMRTIRSPRSARQFYLLKGGK